MTISDVFTGNISFCVSAEFCLRPPIPEVLLARSSRFERSFDRLTSICNLRIIKVVSFVIYIVRDRLSDRTTPVLLEFLNKLDSVGPRRGTGADGSGQIGNFHQNSSHLFIVRECRRG